MILTELTVVEKAAIFDMFHCWLLGEETFYKGLYLNLSPTVYKETREALMSLLKDREQIGEALAYLTMLVTGNPEYLKRQIIHEELGSVVSAEHSVLGVYPDCE